jgi:hypothetical protein
MNGAYASIQEKIVSLFRSMSRFVWIGMIYAAVFDSSALGQPRPSLAPSTTHIFPAGAQRGTTVSVRVGTECSPPGANFFVDGSGVQVHNERLEKEVSDDGEPSARRPPTEIPITYPRQWYSKISLAPDAPLGVAYWRVSCAQGGTGSRPFLIGDLPECIECESNSTPLRAESIELPITVNGQICGERDVDYFQFHADAGQLIVCETIAGRIGSRLDPHIEIHDLAGQRLDPAQSNAGSDPVLVFQPEQSGDYLLRVANISASGSPAHVYRIQLTSMPYVRCAFPSGGQAGTRRDVEFLTLSGRGELLSTQRSILFPGEPGNFIYRDPERALGDTSLSAGRSPSVVEHEPNSIESPMPLTLPVTVDGRCSDSKDEDWYSIRVDRDRRVAITCAAALPGAPAWPVLTLTDASGKPLANSRSVDAADRICHMEWQLKSDVEYRIRVRDQQFGSQGGVEFIYRLGIEPARPDFELQIVSDVLNVQQGNKAPCEISVRRFGGFEGPIDLSFVGMPPGIKVEPTKIPEKANKLVCQFSALDDAPSNSYSLTIVGSANIDQARVEHQVRARHLGCDNEGVAIESSTIDRLHLTVQHKPVFRLQCSEAYMYAHRGSVYPYQMEVQRLNGFDGQILVQRGDRQNRDMDGIEMHDVVIPPGQTNFSLPIYLPETMHINVQGQSQLYAQAYATFMDAYQKPQSVLVLSEKRNMLRTLPQVVKLKAIDPKLPMGKLHEGDTIACRFLLQRTSNFPGAMRLEWIPSNPMEKETFSVEPTTIPAGESEGTLMVRVMQNPAPELREQFLRFRATGTRNEDQVISEDTIQFAMAN